MARILFPSSMRQLMPCPETQSAGGTVREVLDSLLAANPQARGHLLDDRSILRKHILIFVDGDIISDRAHLSDTVGESSTIHIFQAFSGG
jgi:sulfur-carrier protein